MPESKNLNLLATRSAIAGRRQTLQQYQLLSSPANKWGSLRRLEHAVLVRHHLHVSVMPVVVLMVRRERPAAGCVGGGHVLLLVLLPTRVVVGHPAVVDGAAGVIG